VLPTIGTLARSTLTSVVAAVVALTTVAAVAPVVVVAAVVAVAPVVAVAAVAVAAVIVLDPIGTLVSRPAPLTAVVAPDFRSLSGGGSVGRASLRRPSTTARGRALKAVAALP
jgi:hypothetical protein